MAPLDLGRALLPALLFVAACGGAAMPGQKLSDARSAIRGAEEVGAEKTPKASLHLKLARDQVARAERQIRDGDNEEASLTLNQAQADADMALALAHEAREKQAAEQARARVAELRAEAQK